MFISQLTSTSGFDELHFFKELLTAVGVANEGDNFSCMMGEILKVSTSIEFVNILQTIFIISPGVHVSLQFNEFHLAIARTVFHR